MSELQRYLVSVDPANGVVKVERIGEAGDLTEVDAKAFQQLFGPAAPSSRSAPQVVINIFGEGSPCGTAQVAVTQASTSNWAWGGSVPPAHKGEGPTPPHISKGWGGPPAPQDKPDDPGKS